MVSESMFAASSAFAAMACRLKPGDTVMLWEPLYHIGGAQMIGAALANQAALAMVERFSARRFWHQAKGFGANKMHYLGGVLEMLLAQPAHAGERDHNITLAFGAGAKAASWQIFEERFGVSLVEVYGMTEAASFTTINDVGRIGSIGSALPWFDVKLSAEPVGEILVRGKQPGLITDGYVGDPASSAAALREGWLHTGDLGRRLEDGHLVYAGRTKEAIRCRGENVSAFEVETLLCTHPAIDECAIIGVPAEIGEEDIMAYVKTSKDFSVTGFPDWCNAHLASFQIPKYLQMIDDFPRTPSERIAKKLLSRDTKSAITLGRDARIYHSS